VDLERRTVTICENISSNTGKPILRPTKTYASRTIDLPRVLSEQLCDYRSNSFTANVGPLVFPNAKGGYLQYKNWRRYWDPAIEQAGTKVLPHDLRATAASLLIDAGASPKDVQAHLGHSSIEVTMNVYARVRGGRSADLAARLDALIAEAS
jgi:integrase